MPQYNAPSLNQLSPDLLLRLRQHSAGYLEVGDDDRWAEFDRRLAAVGLPIERPLEKIVSSCISVLDDPWNFFSHSRSYHSYANLLDADLLSVSFPNLFYHLVLHHHRQMPCSLVALAELALTNPHRVSFNTESFHHLHLPMVVLFAPLRRKLYAALRHRHHFVGNFLVRHDLSLVLLPKRQQVPDASALSQRLQDLFPYLSHSIFRVVGYTARGYEPVVITREMYPLAAASHRAIHPDAHAQALLDNAVPFLRLRKLALLHDPD